MRIDIPTPLAAILSTLQENGFTCELVGGAVRDSFLSQKSADWDIATNATPEQLLPLFTESFYENAFGTVMVAQKHICEQFHLTCSEDERNQIFDITTYRSDGVYVDHRKPETVTWGTTIEQDLSRRDFTINAIALRPADQLSISPSDPTVCIDVDTIDPFGGRGDIERKIIRTVGDPHERFTQDALRILRAIRFTHKLGFSIESKTYQALQELVSHLQHISMERISEEFLSMLSADRPDVAIHLLDAIGALPYIVPELLEAKNVHQSGHHIYDVWEHSLRSLGACESSDPVVRLATLVHDIAKPFVVQEKKDGSVTFYNHEVVGARQAKQIAARLRLSKKDCDRIFTLVRWHMFTYDTFTTDAYIRRFIRRVGIENLEDMFALRTADRVGSGSKASSWRLEELKERVWAELHQPMKLTDMAIDGHDLMEHFGLQPGPIIGKTLHDLFEIVLDDPSQNTKEALLVAAQKLLTV